MRKFLNKILLLINTIKFLKFSQIYWQIIYRIKKKTILKDTKNNIEVTSVYFQYYPEQKNKYIGNNHFLFLNLEKEFGDSIDWKYEGYGKLWNYNLEYFDYLQQDDISVETKLNLLKDFYNFSIVQSKILEPYPVSLRLINSIKFLSRYEIKDTFILNCLYQESFFLSENLEFHLLGNHLLENGFALLLAGYYFNEKLWIKKGETLLIDELKEQIHLDGAHFELSPMYHQIILFRVLELIDWYSFSTIKNDNFVLFLNEILVKMLSFLRNISFENGDIPHFNDSTIGIAYSTNEIFHYAKILNIKFKEIPLSDSGYRSMSMNDFEVKIDVAQLAIDYQPGHAHADSLGFILYHENKPIFVENGTSTYQNCARRDFERSTLAHNTLIINNQNQSQVWGGFRVGKRAKTKILVDKENLIEAVHDGYKSLGIIVKRSFYLDDDIFIIKDSTNGGNGLKYSIFHLHPLVSFIIDYNNFSIIINEKVICVFNGAKSISLEDYELSDGFNKYLKSKRLLIEFSDKLETIITLDE